MDYNLIITEHAQELLDQLTYHLIFNLRNDQAAKHLLDEIEKIFDRLEENPQQFPKCRDKYLGEKGYKEAIVQHMNYLVIFNIEDDKKLLVNIAVTLFVRVWKSVKLPFVGTYSRRKEYREG